MSSLYIFRKTVSAFFVSAMCTTWQAQIKKKKFRKFVKLHLGHGKKLSIKIYKPSVNYID